ncbi:hypothetical protein ACVGOW_33740 [Pseudonocardia saturnea]
MRLGDAAGPDAPGSGVSDGLAAAVPIGGRRSPGSTAVLDDAVAPPWQRMPPVRLVAATRTPEPLARRATPVTELADRRPPVLSARPRVVEEPGILGLSRLTRGQVGSRLFTLFFVAVFTLIAVQMVMELLHG